ncbi:MAG TPA: glycosyltransferase, partial [Ilumatobacteraceae bacterium]|nr:glycosyltransferase [Ilumatobacteraceae bacterium]
MAEYDIVIPTIGRPSLRSTLRSLEECGAQPRQLVIVDDRRDPTTTLEVRTGIGPVTLLQAGGEGPANARNLGLSRCTSPWVVFLDDDVVVSPTWGEDLDADLRNAGPRVAAIQGDVSVPLPTLRR